MNIRWHTPYKSDGSERYPDPVWPEGWPIPPIGSVVYTGGEAGNPLWVGAVDFFITETDAEDPPFIYIVLRDRPPT